MNNITIYGCISTTYGIQKILVDCSIRNGFPGFDITGLPGTAIKESRERIRAALRASGFAFPQNRVLVNLSPSNIPKEGTSLDLPIALSIAICKTLESCKENFTGDISIMATGELSLNGTIISTKETVLSLKEAIKEKCQMCIIPPLENSQLSQNATEHPPLGASFASTLKQAIAICTNAIIDKNTSNRLRSTSKQVIFSDILGLDFAKNIVSIATAGLHNLMLFGPPGVGKTLLSTRIPILLEKVSSSKPISLFPTHESTTISVYKMVCGIAENQQDGFGGGALVLDEIDKFGVRTIDLLKDVLEGRISHNLGHFMLVANLNPCSCGGLGSRHTPCSCTAKKIENHWNKLGKPFIERFDIRLPLEEQPNFLLHDSNNTTSKPDSFYIDNIIESRKRQEFRYKDIEGMKYNSQLGRFPNAIAIFQKDFEVLSKMLSASHLSMRSHLGIISLARSIADFEDRASVTEDDISMALTLRQYGLGDYYWRSLT